MSFASLNLWIGTLLLASICSVQAVSILAKLKSGKLEDARQVVAFLEKQAAEQKSGEKELTEFLITAIKEACKADYQLRNFQKQRSQELAEAVKLEKVAQKWLEPNAMGSTSPENAERCRKKSEMLKTKSDKAIDEANETLKKKLIILQEAEDFLWDANRLEDSRALKKVIQTMALRLKKSDRSLSSFWEQRERKANPFGSPESQLLPKNSVHQLEVVTGEGAADLTKRLRRKVDEDFGNGLSPEEKDRLVSKVKETSLFTWYEMENRGPKISGDVVFILLEEFEALAVDGVQALKWSQILEKSESPAFKEYGNMFGKKLLERLSKDYHDTAQTTYSCWTEAEAGKKEAFWQLYKSYSGRENIMLRLNCSKNNAMYWLKKAAAAGHDEAKQILGKYPSSERKKKPLPDDSSWWK